LPQHGPQSAGQLKQCSEEKPSQVPLPQQGPQSAAQVRQVSPKSQAPLPQQGPQSTAQLRQVSPKSQAPLLQQGPQSPEQDAQVSSPLQVPSPQTGPGGSVDPGRQMYLSKKSRSYHAVFTPLKDQHPWWVTLTLSATASTHATWPHSSPGYWGVTRFPTHPAVGEVVTSKSGWDAAYAAHVFAFPQGGSATPRLQQAACHAYQVQFPSFSQHG